MFYIFRRLDKQYDDFRMLQRFLLRLICFDEAMEKKLSLGNNMNSELALVGNISKSSSEEMFTFTFTSAKSLPSNLAVKATPIWEVSRFFTLVQKTDRSYAQTTAELVEGLKELDELSRAHVDILGEFTVINLKFNFNFITVKFTTTYSLNYFGRTTSKSCCKISTPIAEMQVML